MRERIEYWLSGKNGLWYYHHVGPDGQIINLTGGFATKNACLTAIHQQSSIPHIEIKELEHNRNKKFEKPLTSLS